MVFDLHHKCKSDLTIVISAHHNREKQKDWFRWPMANVSSKPHMFRRVWHGACASPEHHGKVMLAIHCLEIEGNVCVGSDDCNLPQVSQHVHAVTCPGTLDCDTESCTVPTSSIFYFLHQQISLNDSNLNK